MAEFLPGSEISIADAVDPDFAYGLQERGGIAAALTPATAMESGPIAPPEPAPPFVGIEESTGTVSVNGFEFNKDDHRSALLSEAELDKPITPLKPGFRPIGADEYKTYLDNIDKPSFSRLAKKNFGIGIDVGQLLAGSALKFASFGNETINELGDSVVKQQIKDLAFNEPYQRAFTEGATNSPREAGEWFVANAAQMAPLMMEMILAAFVGGGVGAASVLSTGLTGAGGRFLASRGVKLATRAGRKETADIARVAMKKQAAGQGLDEVEEKALKSVARAGGALVGGAAASYGVAIGDIYGEMEESGTSDRLLAALLAVPYAALEIMPATLAATTAFKAAGSGALGLKTGGKTFRAAKGAVAGGAIEGGTEVGQDILALYGAGKLDPNDPAVQDQLINAFAAGAGVGAPIGGISAAYGKNAEEKPAIDTTEDKANILNPEVLGPRGPQLDLDLGEKLGQAGPTSPDQGGPDTGLEQGELFGATRTGSAADRVTGSQPDQLELPLTARQEGEFDFSTPAFTPTPTPVQGDLFGGVTPEDVGPQLQTQAQEDALFAPLEAQQNIPPVFPEGQTQGELNVEAPVIDQPIPAGFPPVGTSTSYIQSTPQSYDVTPSEPVRSPDGTIVRKPDGTIVEVDQRQPTPVRPPGVNISEIAAAPFVPEGAERSRRFAEDFELAVAERDEQSRPQFIKGEEAILDETTQTLVPVRQLLSKSEKRIDALDQLYNCLKKG
jgi:hypothetical protein